MLGGIQIQPSEVVKPLLILAIARLMTQYPPKSMRNFFLHISLIALPLLLVFRQPDLGTSIVYLSFWIAMMVGAGASLRTLAVFGVVGSMLIPALWRMLASYQKARITTFLNPALDPRGAGYNALQALIAVGSGQLFGRGLGRGTQSHLRFLPEFHTDFIFATIVEELGILGGFLLLIGYAVLLWRILVLLLRGTVTDAFPFTYAVGLMVMMLSQIFINAGMNMGIIPVTGITLPFVSYGGSSILSLCISFGLLWAVARPQDTHAGIAIR
jgi:rod shape determining protein RodA